MTTKWNIIEKNYTHTINPIKVITKGPASPNYIPLIVQQIVDTQNELKLNEIEKSFTKKNIEDLKTDLKQQKDEISSLKEDIKEMKYIMEILLTKLEQKDTTIQSLKNELKQKDIMKFCS